VPVAAREPEVRRWRKLGWPGKLGKARFASTPAATAGNKAYVRGKWCGATATRDPAARARFGIQRSSDETIYSREATQ
jgi:hypothetical protein